MTGEQFYRNTLGALQRELGPAGPAQFLRLNRSANTDYTRDRDFLLGDIRIDDVLARHRRGTRVTGPEIERAIASDDWENARKLIRVALKKAPEDHWLLARLALTHYEQRDYTTALRYGLEAAEIAPACPLVLWEVAGAMDMLDQPSAALRVYRKLTRRSIDNLAHGPCGEGIARAAA